MAGHGKLDHAGQSDEPSHHHQYGGEDGGCGRDLVNASKAG
jgi:hypothetical protein